MKIVGDYEYRSPKQWYLYRVGRNKPIVGQFEKEPEIRRRPLCLCNLNQPIFLLIKNKLIFFLLLQEQTQDPLTKNLYDLKTLLNDHFGIKQSF